MWILQQILFLIGIYIWIVSGGQNAGYYCVSDNLNQDLLHIRYSLDPADDTVNNVYAFTKSGTPLPDCYAELDIPSNIYHLRITINTTTQQQINPASSCGIVFSEGLYTIKIRSFASEGIISSSDRLYTIQCQSKSEANTMGTVTVGSIEHIEITGSNPTATLQLVSVPGLNPIQTIANIGDKVKLRFTLTFSSDKENLDIIGARLKNLIVSPYDSYSPINRTIIDENGCPVNHSENVLEVSGSFETKSNGTSPYIAYSPEFEIARFSIGYNLYFQVYAEYCYNVECFATMCRNRRKRTVADGDSNQVFTQFHISIRNPSTAKTSDTDKTCYNKTTFAAIISVLLVVIVVEVIVVVAEIKKLTYVKAKISPSPDISFEKIPLENTDYHNPVNGFYPSQLRNNSKHVVL